MKRRRYDDTPLSSDETGPLAARLWRLLRGHAVLLLVTLLALAAIWAGALRASAAALEAAQAKAQAALPELLDTYEAQIIRNLAAIEQTLKVTAYSASLNGAAGALPELERKGLLPPGLLFAVALTDRDGNVVASNPPAPASSVAGQAYFREQRQRRSDTMYVSAPSADLPGQDPVLHFTWRMDDAAGRFAGVVSVQVDAAYFTSGYERARLGEHGMLGLFGADNQLRALRAGDREIGGGGGAGRRPSLAQASAAAAWDGVLRDTAVRQLPASGMQVVVGLARDEQMAAARAERRERSWHAALASAGLLLLAALGGVWSWQRSNASRSIRIAQETYAAASEANLDAFFRLRAVRDRSGAMVDFEITGCNTRAELMTGHRKRQLIGMTILGLAPNAAANGMLARLARTASTRGVYEQEWENLDMPQIQARWVHEQLVGVGEGLVAILRDISDRKLAEAHMLHMAQHDTLTGLPNRGMVGERLQHAIAAAREQGAGSAVLVAFIDLDGFKLINDSLGHGAGDQLLQQVTARIAQCLDEGDMLGRFGGDEFVLILPRRGAHEAAAERQLEAIRLAVAQPLTLLGQQVQISCSMGLATFPRDAAGADALLLKADVAMYRAKEAGKNGIQYFEAGMGTHVDEKLALLEDMRRGIAEQQFVLLYQPKIDVRSGAMFGVEALLRWNHPQLGMMSPLKFIPLAEESGLIVTLGEWVLRTACAQNQAWRDAGLAPISVAVNVSARQFDDKLLVAQVGAALADSGLAPDGLELEVTESLIMRDLQKAVAKMAQFKQMGIPLSIDDFGTGYSSLSALKTYPISRLKIDKSFVQELASSADDRAIARAIIAMAHQLHLRVIAEGVETDDQRRFLEDNGCDEMQGYLFSRPVSAAAIGLLLAGAVPA